MQLAVECEGPRAGLLVAGPESPRDPLLSLGSRAGGGAEPALTDSGEDPTMALVSPCAHVPESASTRALHHPHPRSSPAAPASLETLEGQQVRLTAASSQLSPQPAQRPCTGGPAPR